LIVCTFVRFDFFLLRCAGYNSGIVKVFLISGTRQVLTLKHIKEEEEEETAAGTGTQPEGEEGSTITSVECLAFSNESDASSRWLASGGMNKILTIWEVSSGSRRVDCPHEDGVSAVSWHPSASSSCLCSHLLCSASLDTNVRIWDGRNGSCLQVLRGHKNFILSMTLKPWNSPEPARGDNNGQLTAIVSGSDDFTAKVFLVDFQSFLNVNL
jgi:WD40 repeat protein